MSDRLAGVVIIASENAGKARELQAIFAELFPEVQVRRPAELGLKIRYPEEGEDYVANALGKAQAAAAQSGLPAVADDSGIEIEALGWRPGPLSARFGPTDEARNERVLAELAGRSDPSERRARYRAVAAIAFPGDIALWADGFWYGVIVESPRGANGFGYDPIFLDEDLGKTGGEMSADEKALRSHRGKALRALASKILGSARP